MAATAYLKTDCDHCSGPIEFPVQMSGESVECPHCKQQTQLPEFPFAPQPALAPPPQPAPAMPPGFVPLGSEPPVQPPPVLAPDWTPQDGYICETCGTDGYPVVEIQGSFIVELGLWLLFCFPGLIYSLWRVSSREKVCPGCKGKMVALRTPRGQMLWKMYHPPGN